MRVEKRACGQFEFAAAMNTVTEFYCHSEEKGAFMFLFNLLLCIWTSYSWSAGPVLRILTVSHHGAAVSWLCAPVCENPMFVLPCVSPPPGCRSLSSVVSLESPVICCLGPLIQYLREFALERVLRSERYIAQRHGADLAAQVQSVLLRCFP